MTRSKPQPPPKRRSPRGLKVAIGVAVAAGARGLYDRSRPRSEPVSAAGRSACEQRQADLPLNLSSAERRQAMQRCLRSINAELRQQRQTAEASRSAEAAAELARQQAAEASYASPQERYRHCQLQQEQVIAAYRAYNTALSRWMAASRDGSAEQQADTRADLDARLADLDRLIPEAMRAGQPLWPNAVDQFRRCDPASFQ